MRHILFFWLLTTPLACSSSQPDGGLSPDSATETGTYTDIGTDATTDMSAPDSGEVGIDVVGDAHRDRVEESLGEAGDAGDAGEVGDGSEVSTDVVIDPGTCGAGVRRCLCGCAGDGVCNNACIARDLDCGGCLYNAASRCCPDLARVFEGCIDTNMCVDDGCVMSRCGSEQRAFESCFAALQMTDEVCRRELRACLGPDYPMIQCVVP